MNHIKNNPEVVVCGEWFTAHGIGENLGYVRDGRTKYRNDDKTERSFFFVVFKRTR